MNKLMNYSFYKRLIDFFFSLIIIVLLSPIFLVISILILIYQGKPLFFSQKRPGRQERIFAMYKFSSMTNEKDETGNLLPDDKRITKIGSFLRKYSFDELPGLFNVLKGDMSLVGPRPLLIKYLPYYSERERKRHLVRPGMTGLAQVSGRNLLNWDDRLEMDVVYVENLSLKMDFTILFKTIMVVIRSSGVAVNSAEVEPSLIDYRKETA